ncbi:hypothetical protein BS47DRAFT_1481403 [Hydnum rufescens UP504]|uniref:ADF-H domain-containing protein n=1 Tax=Hydnum rufescens UP504 TaxID=1448309 RepID=A0A9P6BB81_9AGAM|nr:hypothetical protein BS47DRAFT_1481403 [Hydnum rufescens UP504]
MESVYRSIRSQSSTSSGIPVSQGLADAYAAALADDSIRFLFISIADEFLVPNGTLVKSGTLSEDLALLQDILKDDVPSYILARLDGDEQIAWLFISYVPDLATPQNKMLYASTRTSLVKSMGDRFKDTLNANSKDELSPASYAAHLRHNAAPLPLSAREAELASIKASERAVTSTSTRVLLGGASHIQLQWTEEARAAVEALKSDESGHGLNLAVLSFNTEETIVLTKQERITLEELANPGVLPSEHSSYIFFAWDHTVEGVSKRDIIFIYNISSSGSKQLRMIYALSVNLIKATVRTELEITLATTLETTDFRDSDVESLKEQLEATSRSESAKVVEEKKPFAKPRGPTRKVR